MTTLCKVFMNMEFVLKMTLCPCFMKPFNCFQPI